MGRSFILLTFIVVSAACSPNKPAAISADYRPVGMLPSKDDLFVADGRPFSASEFEALEERYPSLSPEVRLRLAKYLSLYALLVRENQLPAAVSAEQFSEDLRGLLPPVPSGFQAATFEQRIQKRYRAKNAAAWKSALDARVLAEPFEMNRTLLDEYNVKL